MVLNWREIIGSEGAFLLCSDLAGLEDWKVPTHGSSAGMKCESRQDIIPKSGMACIHDLGLRDDVHPTDKKTVGIRLSHWAMHFDYGRKDLVYSGPLFRSVKFTDSSAIVTFEHAKGLTTRDGKAPTWFELAGENGKWVEAEAKIVGEKVVVTSPEVPTPKRLDMHGTAGLQR